jgi:ABC-type lipoprotein release transport system permease subunit
MWGVQDMEVSGVDFASLVMRSRITPVKWVAASILVALVTLGSALYPAWRASRFEPAEAMRFYQ